MVFPLLVFPSNIFLGENCTERCFIITKDEDVFGTVSLHLVWNVMKSSVFHCTQTGWMWQKFVENIHMVRTMVTKYTFLCVQRSPSVYLKCFSIVSSQVLEQSKEVITSTLNMTGGNNLHINYLLILL